ncbi:MAG: hypothetical protein WBI40_07485 [Methylococcaceae bacterium]
MSDKAVRPIEQIECHEEGTIFFDEKQDLFVINDSHIGLKVIDNKLMINSVTYLGTMAYFLYDRSYKEKLNEDCLLFDAHIIKNFCMSDILETAIDLYRLTKHEEIAISNEDKYIFDLLKLELQSVIDKINQISFVDE